MLTGGLWPCALSCIWICCACLDPRVCEKNPSAEAIPYNESDKVSALPILAADTVMGRVLRDINAAEQLLKGMIP